MSRIPFQTDLPPTDAERSSSHSSVPLALPTATPQAEGAPSRRAIWWLDLLLALILFGAALPPRFAATQGDLWLDEADYALAAVRGFQAQRWDASESPDDPDKLIRLRHYHPPMVAYMAALALYWGTDERALRVPAVLAGGLSVMLVYLCGLTLFSRRVSQGGGQATSASFPLFIPARLAALACAVIMIFAPPHLRASSHALPWSFITLGLLLLLWTLLKYAETRRAGWIVGAGAALGGLFVTSEVFFPALLGAVCAMPFLFLPDVIAADRRKHLLKATAAGLLAFLLLAAALWPAGLQGHSLRMLWHYVAMADDPWPVNLQGTLYERAPKWAYLFWYWHLYRPYLIFYALGAAALLVYAARRRLTAATGTLAALTAVLLFSAHKAHIIGPEYLAHVLPFLALIGGLFLAAVSRWNRLLGLAAAVAACAWIALHTEYRFLNGMDPRARIPRWADAARFLAQRWQPGDRIVAPAYGSVARWYLLHVAGVPVQEWQVQGLPADDLVDDSLVWDIRTGVFRFVAVGSTFSDRPWLDNRIRRLLQTWPVIWQSNERGTGPCRLRIYERPMRLASKTKNLFGALAHRRFGEVMAWCESVMRDA